jgi:UDP-N-acetylglucosamine 2-epimerase
VTQVVAFLGTKAQYIKTAPVLRALDGQGIPYRLVDSGQHSVLAAAFRDELKLKAPDVRLGGPHNVDSIPRAIVWALRLALTLASRGRLRRRVFGSEGTLCLVHGDTPSTLLAALMARRAGLRLVHLESGLRSGSLLHPFPEEAIRMLVTHLAHLLVAPDAVAVENLSRMRIRGRVVPVPGNTSAEALARAVAGGLPEPGSGPAIATMHRVENLHHRQGLEGFVDLVVRVSRKMPTRFVVHGPTAHALSRSGLGERLTAAGTEMQPLTPHSEFIRSLAAAPLVLTDGGSIQEECARLGVPTLLWRKHTERPDGLGANVVLSGYDPATVEAFLSDPECRRRPPNLEVRSSPAEATVAAIAAELASIAPKPKIG